MVTTGSISIKNRIIYLFLLAAVIFSSQNAAADTVYLKNGRSLKGFITNEDNEGVELDVGKGQVRFKRVEIEKIYKSTPEESEAIHKQWDKSDTIYKEERDRFEKQPKDAQLQQKKGHVLADVTINDNAKASLYLDTGASLIVLTNKVGKSLGIDLSQEKRRVQMQTASGQKIEAIYVVLDTVKLQNSEAKNVEAAILPEDVPDGGFGDGLLGMSFLKNFNFKVDYNKGKLVLEKL